jgi:hypothetical protein
MTTVARKLLTQLEYTHEKPATMKLEDEAPIVIGGFGGSGTRVPVLYLLALGVNMLYDPEYHYKGKPIYETLVEFGHKWGKDSLNERMDMEQLAGCIACKEVDKRPWGWKMPSTMVYLQELHKLMPNMKFLHITRDPRDIAGHAIGAWVEMYSPIFDKELEPDEAIREYMRLWGELNARTHRYGTEYMGDNYLHIKLEDLLPRNSDSLAQLAEFAGVGENIVDKKFWNEISTEYNIGRRIPYRETHPFMKNDLKRFGYGE